MSSKKKQKSVPKKGKSRKNTVDSLPTSSSVLKIRNPKIEVDFDELIAEIRPKINGQGDHSAIDELDAFFTENKTSYDEVVWSLKPSNQ